MHKRWFKESDDPDVMKGSEELIILIAVMTLFTLCAYWINTWGSTREEIKDYCQSRNIVVELKVTRLLSSGEGDYRIIGKAKTGEYYCKKVDLHTFSMYEVGDIIKDKYTKEEVNKLRKKSGYRLKYNVPVTYDKFATFSLIVFGLASLILTILVLTDIDWKRPKIILILVMIAIIALWVRNVFLHISALAHPQFLTYG